MSTPDRQRGTEPATDAAPDGDGASEGQPLPASRRWTLRILFALAFAVLAWTVASDLPSEPKKAKGDDGYYLRYMQTVTAEGLPAFPALFEKWNATPTDWIFPPPSRVGYVLTTVVWGKIFGATYPSLRTLSLAAFLALCALNYYFASRHFGEPRGFLIAGLAAFSPLLMGLSRLALSDSLAEAVDDHGRLDVPRGRQDPESLMKRALFMAVLAWAVLVKELSVLLVVPFVAFVLFEHLGRRSPHDVTRIALCFVIPGIAVATNLLLAAGGLEPLRTTVETVLGSPSSNR